MINKPINIGSKVHHKPFPMKETAACIALLFGGALGMPTVASAAAHSAYTHTHTDALSSALQAATFTLRGTVVDQNGETIIGARVSLVEDPTKGTMTDIDGNFSLPGVKVGQTIEVAYVGYATRQIKLTDQNKLTITLKEDEKLLDEVVVVGYGTTSTRKSVGAVTSLKTDKIEELPFTNVAQGLQGRTPGLVIQGQSGAPGSPVTVSIRGGGTPLYIIDGVIRNASDFNALTASDIDKISVLKDASATAVYGSRAGDGIIMVTTKRGRSGKLNIQYTADVSASRPAIFPDKMNALEYVTAVNDAAKYDGIAKPIYTEEQIEKIRTGSDPYGRITANTDWHDLALNKYAIGTRHNLSLSGSSDNGLSYFASAGYLSQNSLFKMKHNNHYERFNMRSNVTARFEETGLELSLNVDGAVEQKSPTVWGDYTVWSQLQNVKPNYAAFNPDGTYSSISIHPLVILDKLAGYDNERDKHFNVQLNAKWDIPYVKGLTVGALGNIRYGDWNNKVFQTKAPQFQPNGEKVPYDSNSLRLNYATSTQKSLDFNVIYAREFGNHSFEIQGVTSYFREDGSSFWASREKYQSPLFDQLFGGDPETQKNDGSAYELARMGYVGRLKYDYASKYMLEFNFRVDQSDNFPPSNRTGFFPSAGLAWVISSEPFMQSLTKDGYLSFFKLRSNFGIVGLEGGDRYGYMPTYNLISQSWVIDGKLVTGFREGSLVSDNFTWYTRQVFDLGADATFLNDRLSLMLDYYYYRTTGYLISPKSRYTTPLGKSLPQVKSQSAHRRAGLEASLRWKDRAGDFNYDLGFNFTTFNELWEKNEAEPESDLKDPNKRITHVKNYYGRAYKTNGLYQDIDQILNNPRRESSRELKPGDIFLVDMNGDGKVDGEDFQRIGQPTFPAFSYGFDFNLEYKGFFLDALFQGTGSRYRQLREFMRGTNTEYITYSFQTDYWTPENRGAAFPRLSTIQNVNSGNNYTVSSDFWYRDAAYLRLKSFQFGYDFTKLLRDVKGISGAKLSLAGTNVLTFSKVNEFFDPELNDDAGYAYPPQKTFSVILNLSF